MMFSRRQTFVLLTGDFLLLFGALWVTLGIRTGAIPTTGFFLSNLIPFIPIFIFSIIIFYIAGLYEKPTRPILQVMGERIVGAQIANVIIAAVFFFLLPLSIAPKTILAIYLVVSVTAITLWRFYALHHIFHSDKRKAILVGHGDFAREIMDEMNESKQYTIEMVEHTDTATFPNAQALSNRINEHLREGVTVVIIDTRDARAATALPAHQDTILAGVFFIDLVRFYEDMFGRAPLDRIDYTWWFDRIPNRTGIYDITKRFFDFIFSIIAGIVALFIIIPVAIILAVTGGTPFIFHERIGKNGKLFRIVKIRTMLFDDHGDSQLRSKNHITAFGSFLRKTRIDELPQLWNVLRGDLSFIGPRPELPSIASVYEKEIPYYHLRHLTVPGLSGWAQIRDYDAPRGAPNVEKTRRKLSYDLYYLVHRSVWLDMTILLKTIRTIFVFSGS
ncbi:MAG TPA: hypothetical protein ENI56_02440 [Candidatus Kaiserbacteria bacterium]|nr:hypothetical protein [Candidatus Kaiserbacteria bacterium]